MWPSYRTQLVDLHYKVVDGFLYNGNIDHKPSKQSTCSKSTTETLENSVKYIQS